MKSNSETYEEVVLFYEKHKGMIKLYEEHKKILNDKEFLVNFIHSYSQKLNKKDLQEIHSYISHKINQRDKND
tara:strand:- start:917 stop:1135 length:219 start_codon:yes stop_codon:yes gene_type:complete